MHRSRGIGTVLAARDDNGVPVRFYADGRVEDCEPCKLVRIGFCSGVALDGVDRDMMPLDTILFYTASKWTH